MTKCPFGSTCRTTTVMVPLKSLLFTVAPLPAKLLAAVPPAVARAKAAGLTPGMAVTEPASVPLLSTELVEVCVALTFSPICTSSVSPTRRARWSSNSGRYCCA